MRRQVELAQRAELLADRRPSKAPAVELTKHDMICADILAARQAGVQAPSVLDVNFASLGVPKAEVSYPPIRRASPVAGRTATSDTPNGDRLHTVAAVAEHLQVSNMTVYRLIKFGAMPAVRVGKSYRIRQRDLEDYLDSSRKVADDRRDA